MFKAKNIIIGVTGGIALYKTLDLIRFLRSKGALARVVMTENACKLISPQVFSAISGNEVYFKMFSEYEKMNHIELAEFADLLLVAPATANCCAKLAYGLADDLLSTLVLAVNCPVLVAPAMNLNMWKNKVVQRNINLLKNSDYKVIDPDCGEMACGSYGVGRLASLEKILFELEKALIPQDLLGKKFLITAGSTIEKIDPVRYISNFSSGKMGVAIAKEVLLRGGEVFFVGREDLLNSFFGLERDVFNFISVQSALEMNEKVMEFINETDVFISAAAVCDFKPKKQVKFKLKKQNNLELEFVNTVDILKSAGKLKNKLFIAGFALETHDQEENAKKKFKEKNMDLLILNGIENLGADLKKVCFFDGVRFSKFLSGTTQNIARRIIEKIGS